MVMPRDWLTSPARTRTDRRLRNRIIVAFLLLMVVTYGGLYLAGVLPQALRDFVALPILLVLYFAGQGLLLWRRADWQNRATYSKDEARDREKRARILGGD